MIPEITSDYRCCDVSKLKIDAALIGTSGRLIWSDEVANKSKGPTSGAAATRWSNDDCSVGQLLILSVMRYPLSSPA